MGPLRSNHQGRQYRSSRYTVASLGRTEAEATTIHLTFETHSTSVDNEAGVATGWLDSPLSPTGRQQARALGAGSRLVVFDDLGHVPHEEDPARTVNEVIRFLGS